jgi:hypothetical protein
VRALLEDERARSAALVEGSVQKIDTLFGALVGNSQRRGEIGENFVKLVHDELRLGVLHATSHARRPGVCDHLWARAACGDAAAPLAVMVETKYAARGDTTEDVEKFLRDVDAGVRTGARNGAIYLSLCGPIAGRARIDVEKVHGVPVLWASRADDDALSARSLVELAFHAFASMWPLLHRAEDAAHRELLPELRASLQRQLEHAHALEPSIRFLEATSEQTRREAEALRKKQKKMVTELTNLQARHAELSMAVVATDDDALVAAATGAIRAHHKRRGRYAKTIDDVGKEDLDDSTRASLRARPDVFYACDRAVRDENQGGKKRPRPPADE